MNFETSSLLKTACWLDSYQEFLVVVCKLPVQREKKSLLTDDDACHCNFLNYPSAIYGCYTTLVENYMVANYVEQTLQDV